MSYAVAADLRARFGPQEIDALLAQDCDGQPDETRLTAALGDADAAINARLAEAWDLPLPAGDYPLLTAIACDLARARLYDDEMPDAVRLGARRARSQLSALVKGAGHLVSAEGVTVTRRANRARITGPKGPAATALGAPSRRARQI